MKSKFISVVVKILFLFLFFLNNQVVLAGLPLPEGFPTNLRQEDLGEFVGSGAFKSVYKVKGFEDYVVAYYTNASACDQTQKLQREIDFLDELRAKGIRTVDNYGMVQVDGQPAYVMRYIQDALSVIHDLFFINIDPQDLDFKAEILNRLNQNSLNDMNLLSKAMHKYKNLTIADLQFLLARDGHLYLNDPMKASFGRYDALMTIETLSSSVFEKLYGDRSPLNILTLNTKHHRFLKLEDYKSTPLGRGASKTVHEINNNPDYVVAISKTDYDEIEDFAKVLRLLDEAESYGINTVKHYGLVAVETTEGIKPGILMENISDGLLIKNLNLYFQDENIAYRFNQHTLDDLDKFKQAALANERFVVDDLQFLLRRDGHLVFIDPAVVSVGLPIMREAMLRDIDSIKQAVQERIALRGTTPAKIQVPKRVMFIWIGGKPKLYEGGRIKPAIWADLDPHIPIELYYDPDNMFAGLLKKMIKERSIIPPYDPNYFSEKQMQLEMQFADYVKLYGLSDATRIKFMKEVLRADPDEIEQEANAIRKYWREDFAIENPKVKLLNIQGLFASQDARIAQLKKAYERELTYRGGNVASASDIVRIVALDQRGGLYVDHDVSLKTPTRESLNAMFDFINEEPEKFYFLFLNEVGHNNNVIATLPHSELTQFSINNMIERHNQLVDNPLKLLSYERQVGNVGDTFFYTGPGIYVDAQEGHSKTLEPFMKDMGYLDLDSQLSWRKKSLVYLGDRERQKIILVHNLTPQQKKNLVQIVRAELEQNGIDNMGYLKIVDTDTARQQISFSNEERYPLVNPKTTGVDLYAFGSGVEFEYILRRFKDLDLKYISDITVIKQSSNKLSTKIHNILHPEDPVTTRGGCVGLTCGLFGKERGEYVKEIESELASGKVTYKELTTYQQSLADRYIIQAPVNTKEAFGDRENLNTFELEKDMKKSHKANKDLLSLVKEWKQKSVEFLESQGLDPKSWVPLTKNTQKLENGNYQIEYLNKNGIEEDIRKFEVSDEIHLKLKLKIDEISELSSSLRGIGSIEGLEEGASSNGVGQVGMGLVVSIQALIHSTNENWWGNKELKGIYFNAVRAQLVINLAQAALSVPMTAIEMISIYRELIGSVVPKTFSRVFAVEGAVSVGFSVANLVLDSIQLSNSTTAQQRVYSGVMVAFDSVALGLAVASIALALVGAAAASVVTGGIAAPIAAIGFGTAILAQCYQAKLDQAEKIAEFFTDRRDEYFATDIVDLNDSNSSNKYQYVNASLPVKSINFKSGIIDLDTFYVYDAKNYDEGPVGTQKCSYYNRRDSAHRTSQQKQNDAISAVDVWKQYPHGMETIYTDPEPLNAIRLTKKSFDPDLSHVFVLPPIAPYYVAYKYSLISFSSIDPDLRYIRAFNEFGAYYNPGVSVDQGWNEIEFVKSLKSHDLYITLNDANRTLVQPQESTLSQGVLNYRIFGPISDANNVKRVNIVSNASQGGKSNHFFIYKGLNQDFVISGLKGAPEYKGVEYFDTITNINTSYEGVVSDLGHLHFKVGDDHIYITTLPRPLPSYNVHIYLMSDGVLYRIIGDSFESINDKINIESFGGDIIKARPFLKKHTPLDSIVHVGNLVKLKDKDGEYRVPTWFHNRTDMFLYPQISRENKSHDIELLKIIQDNNATRVYFLDHTSKRVFSNISDKNSTQFVEYSENSKKTYFQNSNSGDITDAFLSYTGSLLAYAKNGYLYSLVKDQNSSQTYSILGLNYDAYINSGKTLSDLNSSLHTIAESFNDKNITTLIPNFIEITRDTQGDEVSKSYWYDRYKNRFAYKDGAYKERKNGNMLADMFEHYALVYDTISKKMYASPIVSHEEFISKSNSISSQEEIFTNERHCLDNVRYQGGGIFYGVTCSPRKVFRAENGIGQYRKYTVDTNAMFSDNMLSVSNTIALYPQFLVPDGQNTLNYMKSIIDSTELELDANTEYLPWFTEKNKDKFKFYVVPDKDGPFKYGAQFYAGLQSDGVSKKYADHRYIYVGYDKSQYKGYLFKGDTQELIEIHNTHDVQSKQILKSAQSYQKSALFELIDANSTQDSEFVVPYIDNRQLLTIIAKDRSKIIFKEGLKEYSSSTSIDVDLSEINSSKISDASSSDSASNSLEIDFAFGDDIAFRDSYLGKEIIIKEGNNSVGSIFLSGVRLSLDANESSTSDSVDITLHLRNATKEIQGYIQPDKSNLASRYDKLYRDSLEYKVKHEIGYIITSNEIDITTDDILNDLQLKDSNGSVLYTSNSIKKSGKDYLIKLQYKDNTKPDAYIYLTRNTENSYHINIVGDDENIVQYVSTLSYKINSQESYSSVDLILQGTPNRNYPVCFYTDRDYQGDKSCVKYNTHTPYLFAPFDNNISSIEFDQDANQTYVRVYTGEDFTANTIRYSASQSSLDSPFDCNISSFTISDNNTTKLPFGIRELSEPNENYPVCLYSENNSSKICYTQGTHLLHDTNGTLNQSSIYSDWEFELNRDRGDLYIRVKRPNPLNLSNRYFTNSSLEYILFKDNFFNSIDTGIYLPDDIDKIKLTYNNQSIEIVPVTLGDGCFIKIDNFNNSNKMLELYFTKELGSYFINFYGDQNILDDIDLLKIEYIKNSTNYYIGSVVSKSHAYMSSYKNILQISTFDSGCIADVNGYAEKISCNPLDRSQMLNYTTKHTLQNPFTNMCLTVASTNTTSKVMYARCQDANAEQIFSYNSGTKQFLHTASHKCLDIGGENKKDITIGDCRNTVNQQFKIDHIWQKRDEYNITENTPLITKNYYDQEHQRVYFITPKQIKAQGETDRVWYKRGQSEIQVLVLDSNHTYHTAKLYAQKLTKSCSSTTMNSGAGCRGGSYRALKVWFDRSANPQLPSDIYRGSFDVLAKEWHNKSYTQPMHININLDLTNIAFNKPTRQSSNYSHSSHPVSSKAVDGNTNGNFNAHTTTHTNRDSHAWWQVDLQGYYDISKIEIYNRTDCCSDRLNNAKVFISERPFGNDNLQDAQNKAIWTGDISTAKPKNSMDVNGAKGRYVRVQLTGRNFLSLAEVKVFGEKAENRLHSTGVPSEFNAVVVSKTNPKQTIHNLKKIAASWASQVQITSEPFTQIDIPEGFSSGDSVWFNFYKYYYSRYDSQRLIVGVKIRIVENNNTFEYYQTDAKYKILTQEEYNSLMSRSKDNTLDPYLVNLENNSTGYGVTGSISRGYVVKDIALEFDDSVK